MQPASLRLFATDRHLHPCAFPEEKKRTLLCGLGTPVEELYEGRGESPRKEEGLVWGRSALWPEKTTESEERTWEPSLTNDWGMSMTSLMRSWTSIWMSFVEL